MEAHKQIIPAHPQGEQPMVEPRSTIADTFAGHVHVEWDPAAPVTPFGQLPFFIDYLKQAGLFDAWVADCPLSLTSPNAPTKRDLLGTVLLSVLAGHRRYAHITALRCDAVNPPLLGMRKVRSEDSVRRGLAKIDEAKGLPWLQNHLDYCTAPLLGEPWVLDMDSTVKPLYGHQEGAEVGYNPAKRGRPSHAYHTYMLSSLRLVLRVDVLPAHDGERQAVAGTRDAAIRLGGCRPGLAGQGNQPAAGGLEPPAADRSAAPQIGPRSGARRYGKPRAAAAGIHRDRAGQERLGTCCPGHLAGQRDTDAGAVVPRPGGLRKRLR